MIAALLKEKADEIKHKDFCTQGLNDNARAQELKARDIDDLEAEIETLTSTIDELTKSIATLADQRETQKLLNSALNVLKAVYAKKFLLQVQTDKKQEPAGPPPPPGFGTYKKQSSGGVMGMLEQIIADTKTLEAEAIKAESDAQK